MQRKAVYLLFCKFTLHVSDVNKLGLATLDGGSCTKNMTNAGGLSYSFVCS